MRQAVWVYGGVLVVALCASLLLSHHTWMERGLIDGWSLCLFMLARLVFLFSDSFITVPSFAALGGR